ncbi:MAG: hypothetical protein WA055_02230 [Candidatus Moraniibacteriota bacterium]
MDEENKKIEYITKDDLSEQTQIILSAMEQRFGVVDKRFEAVDKQFEAIDKRFDSVDNRFGIVDTRFNMASNRLDEVESNIKHDINNVQILIDGYVKAQENMREEFVIMKEEMKQIKRILKDKLGLEVSAV